MLKLVINDLFWVDRSEIIGSLGIIVFYFSLWFCNGVIFLKMFVLLGSYFYGNWVNNDNIVNRL